MKVIEVDKKDEMLQEAKIFALMAPTILPLIDKRKKDAQGRLIQAYRSGKADNITIVAELSVLSDLENEINQKRLLYDTLAEGNNGRTR